jgi:hypothetical protein
MRRFFRLAAALFFAACLIQTVGAATIDIDINYKLTNLGGDYWQYDYTITNNTDSELHGFAIYFDYGYSGLSLVTDPASWEEWEPGYGVWQDNWLIMFGDPFDYNRGELAALSDTGIAPGGVLDGLSVSFNWLGQGIPGNQLFELFDANFVSLGMVYETSPSEIPTVPEPQTFAMLGIGIVGLAAYYRRNLARK